MRRGSPDAFAARGAACAMAFAALFCAFPAIARPAALAQVGQGPAQNAFAGSVVFGAKGCVRCHAVEGVGGATAPDLARVARPRSFFAFAAELWNRHVVERVAEVRDAAPEASRMSARDVENLVAFLFTLRYFDPPGDIERGRRLFREKQCIRCHQIGGVGGVVGPNLDRVGRFGSPILVAAAMWNHGPAMADAMRERGIERPRFDESELVDLIAYLRSVAPEPRDGVVYVLPGRADRGERLFREKQCIVCHSVRGRGGDVGPDLADRAVGRSLTEFAAAMWNKAPKMLEAMRERGVAVPQLAGEEMADLIAYLYAVQYFGDAGDPERGRALVAQKGCLRCHTVGGRTAADLERLRGKRSDAAVVAALWNHIAVPREGATPPWPTLSSDELADLAAFLRTTGPRR
jgi:mono/diheme cytochrome c family protein